MKIQELLNLDKEIKKKKEELQELKEEIEEYQLMLEINQKETREDLIDITDVYVYQNLDSNTALFVEKRVRNLGGRNPIDLINIFTEKSIQSISYSNFLMLCYAYYQGEMLTEIGKMYPEVKVYPDNLVPKLLLQKLYYRANGVDKKVLKRGALKEV